MQNEHREDSTRLEGTVYEQIETVEQLAEQFVQSIRAGHNPNIDEFVAAHPELASQIRELFPTILLMERARLQSLANRLDGRVQKGPEPIRQLGDFKIGREIGRGGMGIVYEATQQSLDRRVALKVLPNRAYSQSRLEQFERESRLAANLHHTNIVPVYGVGENDGYHYFVMQLIDGLPLSQFVARSGSAKHESSENPTPISPLSIKQICRIGVQVAKALHYAHLQGIFHRDIKPANLILDKQQNVWITDFGLAVTIDQIPTTESGSSVPGTLAYLPPEKLAGQSDTNQTDIYSLGITLIELLLGGSAFEFSNFDELVALINSGKIRNLSHDSKPLPLDLESVVRKSISVDPGRRYQTAKRFAEDLQNFLDGRPVSCRPLSRTYVVSRWLMRNPALAAMAAVVVLLMMAITVVSTTGFFRIQAALKSESAERQNAEDASRLASSALNKIFSRFSPDSKFVESGRELNLTQPVLSDEVVAMLQDLLVFYQQLAARQSDDPELAFRASLAQCRVGEINERLGNYELAVEAYQTAVTDFQRLPNNELYVLQKARLKNQLGFVYRTIGNTEESEKYHQQAIEELGKPNQLGTEPDQQLALELARTYYYMGHQIRPGFGPNSLPPPFFGPSQVNDSATSSTGDLRQNPRDLEHLNQAILILNSIRSDQSSIDVAKRHLLSVCYRELATDEWDQRTPAEIDANKRSVKLLGGLIEDFPKETAYRFDLMQTLAEINVFEANMKTETIERANLSLEQAIELGEQLVDDRPDLAAYRLALTHAYFKQATLCDRLAAATDGEQRQNLFDESERLYRRALVSQSYLVRRYPNQPGYNIWLARFSLSLAKCENLKNRTEQRQRYVGRALANLANLPDEWKNRMEVQSLLREANPFAE